MTDDLIGQIDFKLGPLRCESVRTSAETAENGGPSKLIQHARSRLRFSFVMTDLAGSPQELVNPDSGIVSGYAEQSLYGLRTWRGDANSQLLFAGQYLDSESGWAYNRYRFYDPRAGVYNAQDPLGVAPRVASAQGYVDHPAYWTDFLGLNNCPNVGPNWIKRHVDGKTVYQQAANNVFNPHLNMPKPIDLRTGPDDLRWTNKDRMAHGWAPIGVDGYPVNLHHIGQDNRSALVEITKTRHKKSSSVLHIFSGVPQSQWPRDVIPVERTSFNQYRKQYWINRAKEF